jgi:hypothetical protein
MVKYPKIKKRLEAMKAEPPGWAKGCPRAFVDYVTALNTMLTAFETKDVDMAMLAVSNAWVAGQDSISEKKED